MTLTDLENKINIIFNDKSLLKEALVHRSYLNEHPSENLSSNERLEFLGDAVLELTVSKLLFDRYPKAQEGLLTEYRSKVVRTLNLSNLAKKNDLGRYLFLSKGEEEGGGRENLSLLENVFEALVGAIYLDQGIEVAAKFIEDQFIPEIEALAGKNLKDCKSILQEKSQEIEKITPTYKVLKEDGPDHAKIFTVGVYLGDKLLAEGTGKSKQEAEECSARLALEKSSSSE